ncbi:hypothetical protein ACUY4Q_002137 [Phytobacter sp. AG2a]
MKILLLVNAYRELKITAHHFSCRLLIPHVLLRILLPEVATMLNHYSKNA